MGHYGPFDVDLVADKMRKVTWECDTGIHVNAFEDWASPPDMRAACLPKAFGVAQARTSIHPLRPQALAKTRECLQQTVGRTSRVEAAACPEVSRWGLASAEVVHSV